MGEEYIEGSGGAIGTEGWNAGGRKEVARWVHRRHPRQDRRSPPSKGNPPAREVCSFFDSFFTSRQVPHILSVNATDEPVHEDAEPGAVTTASGANENTVTANQDMTGPRRTQRARRLSVRIAGQEWA